MTVTDTYTPQELEPLDDGGATARSSRKPILVAIVSAAVLGLGAGLYLMLGQSGGGDDSQFRLAPTVSSPSAAAPSAKPADIAVPAKIGTRDPFKALKPGSVPAPVVGADTSGSGTATSTGAGSSSTPALAPTSAPVTPSSVTVSVTSINLAAQTAVVDIDGKKYATGIGKPFADKFSVYSVFNAQCIGIIHGSTNTPVCLSTPVTIGL